RWTTERNSRSDFRSRSFALRPVDSERLEGDDRAGVLDAGNGLHLLVYEVTDVGPVLDVEFHQQVEVAGGRIDLGGDLGVREAVGHLVGFAELAFDLDEGRDHSQLRAATDEQPGAAPQVEFPRFAARITASQGARQSRGHLASGWGRS